MVRAKFNVESITHQKFSKEYESHYSVTLKPVYDSNKESENGKFYNATPSGEIILGGVKEAVAKQFNPGDEFYIDFRKAE